jgi:hypothetical protein
MCSLRTRINEEGGNARKNSILISLFFCKYPLEV